MTDKYPWLTKVPPGYWKKKSSRIFYMEWLGQILNYKTPQDWYKVTRDTFVNNHGASLVRHFNSFPFEIVKEYHPEYEYKKWLFSGSVGNDYWENIDNVLDYMEWLKGKLGIIEYCDWYEKLSAGSIRQHNGWGLLKKYEMFPAKLLLACYPDYDWKPFLFQNVPMNTWKNQQNRLDYMTWLKKELKIQRPKDWYCVTCNIIKKNKGRTLLRYKTNIEIIQEYQSDYHYYEWKFTETPKHFWHTLYNRSRYLYWLGEKLGFKKADDWYSISIKHFRDNYGRALLLFHSESPAEVVVKNIEWNWDIEKFSLGLKNQKLLFNIVRSLFPGKHIYWNYWHPELVFSDTGSKMQLDIFVPEKRIAFEYQGEQHYKPIPKFGGDEALQQIRRRDEEKKSACSAGDIELIEIPYSWNGTKEYVLNLLKQNTDRS